MAYSRRNRLGNRMVARLVKHFFTGLHQPSDAGKVDAGFISVVRLRGRKSSMPCPADWPWVMDSGAFSTILTHGGYPHPPEEYAAEIRRWAANGRLMAAVAQDYMCEAHMLAITGLTIAEHQRLTIERYDALTACDTGGIYVMPVLQGYAPADYVSHIRQYDGRLPRGLPPRKDKWGRTLSATGPWAGVGSVCKRNGDPASIEDVLLAIHRERPDLRLHGFGIKTTALGSALVRDLLWSADSMGWSYAARKQGRNANDYREAVRFGQRIKMMPQQHSLFGGL